MLTIKMLANKQLVNTTTNVRLYQRQSMVDAMQFLLPETYDDISLAPFTVCLEYIDPVKVAHKEILTLDEELYKEQFLRYTLPLDSKFTYAAGTLTLKLTLTWQDEETNSKYVLKTDELDINIMTSKDYFAFVDDSSLTALDNKIMELQTKADELAAVADTYASIAVDDLTLDDGDVLKLSSNGRAIGEGVTVAIPVVDPDGVDDGVIDLDSSSEDPDDNSVAVVDL